MILRWVNKVPAMATCSQCNLKFFTPQRYATDPFGAEEYLKSKFEEHLAKETHAEGGPNVRGTKWNTR